MDEFIRLPIISEDAFKAIDRNKDGFLTRGELKMTNKSASMGEVGEVGRVTLNSSFFMIFLRLKTKSMPCDS